MSNEAERVVLKFYLFYAYAKSSEVQFQSQGWNGVERQPLPAFLSLVTLLSSKPSLCLVFGVVIR